MRDLFITGFTLFFFLALVHPLEAQVGIAWPEADKLFHTDNRWLGADAAYSVDLGNSRVLWLFGDTWIANPGSHSRRNAAFVRSSVAIESGYDPSHASIKFYWKALHGQPSDFLPAEGKVWMWLSSGLRLGPSLILFAERVAPDPSPKSLGFRSLGWNAYLVRNPDSDPSTWKPQKIAEQRDTVTMASAVLYEGSYVYLSGESDQTHDLYVARVSATQFTRGHLDSLEWWNGTIWSIRKDERQSIIRDPGTEASVQRDPMGTGFIEVNSRGFGASDIVLRHASSLKGPWSIPKTVYRPPESDQADPFVYAGKSHPELVGADLVFTYATNGFTDSVMDRMDRYFPRFVRVTLQDYSLQQKTTSIPALKHSPQ